MQYKEILGHSFNVTMDRPVGTVHPKHPEITYPINYGYVPNIIGGDGEEQDVYILGCNTPLEKFYGKVIAIIHRNNDVEDKWVMTADDKQYTKEEVRSLTNFQEQFYDIEIFMWNEI